MGVVHKLCCTICRFLFLSVDFLLNGVVLGWASFSKNFTVCRLLVASWMALELEMVGLAFVSGWLFALFDFVDSVDSLFLSARCSCWNMFSLCLKSWLTLLTCLEGRWVRVGVVWWCGAGLGVDFSFSISVDFC